MGALSAESGPEPSKVQTTSCCPASPAISSKMSLVFSLLMGTSIAAALVILAALYITKTNRTMPRLEKRKTSHVTEVLQVDMIDRRLRSTSPSPLPRSSDVTYVMTLNRTLQVTRLCSAG